MMTDLGWGGGCRPVVQAVSEGWVLHEGPEEVLSPEAGRHQQRWFVAARPPKKQEMDQTRQSHQSDHED
jgi:hypothetical protein